MFASSRDSSLQMNKNHHQNLWLFLNLISPLRINYEHKAQFWQHKVAPDKGTALLGVWVMVYQFPRAVSQTTTNGWLQMVLVLEAKSPNSRCWQGRAPAEDPRKDSIPDLSLSSWWLPPNPWRSWAGRPISPVSACGITLPPPQVCSCHPPQRVAISASMTLLLSR